MDKTLSKLPKFKFVIIALSLYALIFSILVVAQSLALSKALAIAWESNVTHEALVALAIFVGCFLTKALVESIQEKLMEHYALKRTEALARNTLHAVFSHESTLQEKWGSTYVSSCLLEGLDQVQEYIQTILPRMVSCVFVPLVILVVVFNLDVISGSILLIAYPVTILFMILIGNVAKEKAIKGLGEYQRMSNHFIDTLRGLKTLTSFGVSKPYSSTIFNVSERFREATVKTISIATLSGFVLNLIETFSIAALAIMLAFRMIQGDVSLFIGLACLVLGPEYFRPLRVFANDFHASLDGKNALADIDSMIKEIGMNEDSKSGCGTNAIARPTPFVCRDLTYIYSQSIESGSNVDDKGLRTLKQLQDSDSGNSNVHTNEALSKITFDINEPLKVGIVGESGAGKSTLINILAGFTAPNSGSFEINGQAFDSLINPSWHKSVLYIPQSPYIFKGTLKDNISFYTPEASNEDIQTTVEALGLNELVQELPQGLNTVIGDGGRTLSGGQAQRIALARAMLDKSRSVLIFDEPTAHLDIETEYELKQSMIPLMDNRLVFFATHRLHWLSEMDWLLLLENGELIDQGPTDEVRSRHPKLYVKSFANKEGEC